MPSITNSHLLKGPHPFSSKILCPVSVLMSVLENYLKVVFIPYVRHFAILTN